MNLSTLHQEYLSKLKDGEEIEYLLNSMDYLKNNDLEGWLRTFSPSSVSSSPVSTVKRRRCSPQEAPREGERYCKNKECRKNSVHDDVLQGCVVCTACGTIQGIYMENKGAFIDAPHAWNPAWQYVVHHYSRQVYLRSILWAMQGQTNAQLTPEEDRILRQGCVGKSSVSPADIKKIINTNKLRTVLCRHVESLAAVLSPVKRPLLYIDAQVMLQITKMFAITEYHWMKGLRIEGRKLFPSYRFLILQYAYHLDYSELCLPTLLMKTRSSLIKHMTYYRKLCETTKWKVYEPLM